jgi:hypothetical protein
MLMVLVFFVAEIFLDQHIYLTALASACDVIREIILFNRRNKTREYAFGGI